MYQQLKTVICIGLYGIKYTMASAFSNIVCFCSELRLSNNYSNSYSENKTLGEIDRSPKKRTGREMGPDNSKSWMNNSKTYMQQRRVPSLSHPHFPNRKNYMQLRRVPSLSHPTPHTPKRKKMEFTTTTTNRQKKKKQAKWEKNYNQSNR